MIIKNTDSINPPVSFADYQALADIITERINFFTSLVMGNLSDKEREDVNKELDMWNDRQYIVRALILLQIDDFFH